MAGVPLLRRRPRTRTEIVAAADRARARGRIRKAVAGYREALAADPEDASLNVKIAPLLARLGEGAEGARCFRRAAERHLAAGFTDRAAAVCANAAGVFPLDPGFRRELARLHALRGRRADAVGALVDGGRVLAAARQRAAATSLLRAALELEPLHVEARLALAPILAAEGEREQARALLRALEGQTRGRDLRRVRWAAFRLSPSPGALWRWVTASFAGGGATSRGSGARR
ncbi:MAG TPA: tetratricopeptide repeat protein [Anaeromyxobacter sp.]|nr:tetratricopeptide repeat protein [Anaeromyxobacter sp.]